MPGGHIYFDRQRPATWPDHKHQQLQITVIFAGAECVGVWRTRDGIRRRHRIGDNSDHVLVMPAGHEHAIEWHKEADVVSFYLEADWSKRIFAREFLHVSIEPLEWYVEAAPIIGEMAAIFRRKCQKPPSAINSVVVETMGGALAAQLLYAHAISRERTDISRATLPGTILDRVRSHIAHNLDQDLSLAALSRVAGLSPSYFGQLFRASTGIPPHTYVTQKRIIRARELLATGDYRVSEVSDLVGFTEPHRMNYYFRRYLSTCPSAYLPHGNERIRQ